MTRVSFELEKTDKNRTKRSVGLGFVFLSTIFTYIQTNMKTFENITNKGFYNLLLKDKLLKGQFAQK